MGSSLVQGIPGKESLSLMSAGGARVGQKNSLSVGPRRINEKPLPGRGGVGGVRSPLGTWEECD
jgi:hypothetical protein